MSSIREALAGAQKYLDELQAPNNEANTCDWIIRPLLLSIGYQNHEIHAQSSDVANKFPDYTILPNSDHTWYLEAKAWNVGLESIHVDQALNYAHSNGRRWVVLSNGKEWRLYDDQRHGKSADRLVDIASLEDTERMERFLEALSRSSMQDKGVESYANEKRLREIIGTAIRDPKSSIIQAIVKVLRKDLGSGQVSANTIVDILNAINTMGTPENQSISIQSNSSIQSSSGQKASQSIENSHIEVFISGKGLRGKGLLNGKRVTVLSGSEICKYQTPSCGESGKRRLQQLIKDGILRDNGNKYVTLRDIDFKTPSTAARIVLGRSASGWDEWLDKEGNPIQRYRNQD